MPEEEEEEGFTFRDRRRQSTEEVAPAPVVTPTLPIAPVTEPEPTLYDPHEGYSDSDSDSVGDPDGEESSEIPDVRSVLALFMGELRNLAWLRMGLVANPMTGEIEKDLAQAQMAINTVGFLADQLEPHVAPEERLPLKAMISDLQLNFVEQSKRG
ncbi:DUF1844 domain-containing protein [Armatimonas sp.]|uniref:DUF1844 domain-containing protein n=1 Tax=Armatimonas sp. TaxID=1872638 RepID=UPI003753E181